MFLLVPTNIDSFKAITCPQSSDRMKDKVWTMCDFVYVSRDDMGSKGFNCTETQRTTYTLDSTCGSN